MDAKRPNTIFIILLIFASLGALWWLQNNKSTGVERSEIPPPAMPAEKFRVLNDKEQLRIVKELAVNEGFEEARNFLKRIYPDEPADEHELIHMIGEAAFIKLGYNGFGVCDSFFSYGCYHGVVMEALRQYGDGEEVLQNLAKGCLNLPANKTVITACVHGVGHGLMVLRSYDLLRAYKDCDNMFKDNLDLFYCHDGVSMENVVRRATAPGAKDFLTSKDPLFPCSTIPEKYRPACAREHIHYVRREFYNKDTLKSAEYCLHFDELTRSECFGGLGGAINQDFPNNPEIVIGECKKIGPRYGPFCLGRAAGQYGWSKQFDYGALVCNAMDRQEEKLGCLNSLEYIKSTTL